MEEIKRIGRELKYKGQLVEFYSDSMKLPNGKVAQWDFIRHKGAAAVVPVAPDGKIIMVRQYRNAVEMMSLEIPAGCLNEGEDEITCAVRELEEETGYCSKNVKPLLELCTTVAFCNEKIGIFYATDLVLKKQHLDEDEFLNVEKYSLEELEDMIFKGVIVDAKTIAAILAYKVKVGQQESI